MSTRALQMSPMLSIRRSTPHLLRIAVAADISEIDTFSKRLMVRILRQGRHLGIAQCGSVLGLHEWVGVGVLGVLPALGYCNTIRVGSMRTIGLVFPRGRLASKARSGPIPNGPGSRFRMRSKLQSEAFGSTSRHYSIARRSVPDMRHLTCRNVSS